MDWVEGIAEVLPVIRLDEQARIVSMSPAALLMFGVKEQEARGQVLSDLGTREQMLSQLPDSWRVGYRPSNQGLTHLLEQAARSAGNATLWIWLLSSSGRLFRGICNMIKLERGFVVYTANVEDPFSRGMVRAERDGTIVTSSGGRWTFDHLRLLEDFISGDTLQQLATNHQTSTSRVRTVLDKLAESNGFNTASEMRAAIYRTYVEEVVPARQNIFPVLCANLPGFPLHDTPPN